MLISGGIPEVISELITEECSEGELEFLHEISVKFHKESLVVTSFGIPGVILAENLE